MKVAIAIPTGRPRVKDVVRLFIENSIIHGYNPKDFSIYLSIDTKYQGTKKQDFMLDTKVEKKVKKVEYICDKKRKIIGKEIQKIFGIKPEIIRKLFIGNGYSKQRNAALVMALIDKNDIAICIDDDEIPIIPVKKENGEVEWKNLDFFGPHIKELSNKTDITRGPYIGYKSPIPSDFEKDVPEEIRIKLGEALQFGSDVITRDSFFNLINKIIYLPEKELTNPSRPFVVKEGKHGKHIYAGNMGINLKSIREGKIPVFYTPPKSRGEDTIFALQLKKVKVKEVPSYIFHDPFNIYPEIFEGKFPKELESIPVTDLTKKRFISALTGWIMYAPILIYMTSKNEKEKHTRINKMLDKIQEPTKQLAEIFKSPELNDCFLILQKYYKNVKKHHKDLIIVQKEWKNKIVPFIIHERN